MEFINIDLTDEDPKLNKKIEVGFDSTNVNEDGEREIGELLIENNKGKVISADTRFLSEEFADLVIKAIFEEYKINLGMDFVEMEGYFEHE